jgi:hypothetical protein
VADSCTAVYLLCYSFWGRSCVGFLVWSLWSVGVRGGGGVRRASKIRLGGKGGSSFKWLLFKDSV